MMNGKGEVDSKKRLKLTPKIKIPKKVQKTLIGGDGDQPPNFDDQATPADQKLKIFETTSPATTFLANFWSDKNRHEDKIMPSTSSSSNLPLKTDNDDSTAKSNSGSPDLPTGFPINDEEILAVGTQMEDGDKLLSKLKRFLKTVYYFSKNLLPKQHDFVKELILKVIGEEIDEQIFYEKLYDSTRFPLRPYVVPFMKASLPLLRKEYEDAAEDIMESMLFFDSNKTDDRLTNLLTNDQLSLVNTNNSGSDNLNNSKMVAHSTKKSRDKDQQLYQQQQQQQLILATSSGALIGQYPANQTFQIGQNPLNLNLQSPNMTQSSSKRTNNGDSILRVPQATKAASFSNAQNDMDVLQHRLMPSSFGSANTAGAINGSGSGLVASQTYGAIKHNAGSTGAPQLVSSNNASNTMQPLHLFNMAGAASNNVATVSTAMTSPKIDADSTGGSLFKMSNNRTELMSPNDEHWAQVETLFSNMTSTLDKLRHAMLYVHQRAKLAQLWGEKCQQQNQQRQREQSDQKIAQLKQKADAVVNEVKSAAVAELQRAVLAAEQKAVAAIASEKAKMEKMLSESRVQEDSVENCWNCGRKAGQTCSGCGCARYCGVFCQHKDWNRHRADCGKMAQTTAGTPPATVNGGGETPSSKIQPPASTSSLLLSPKAPYNQGTIGAQAAISRPQMSGATQHSSSAAAAATLMEFRKFFHVDPQGVKNEEEDNVGPGNGEKDESPWKRSKTQSDRATTRSV